MDIYNFNHRLCVGLARPLAISPSSNPPSIGQFSFRMTDHVSEWSSRTTWALRVRSCRRQKSIRTLDSFGAEALPTVLFPKIPTNIGFGDEESLIVNSIGSGKIYFLRILRLAFTNEELLYSIKSRIERELLRSNVRRSIGSEKLLRH